MVESLLKAPALCVCVGEGGGWSGAEGGDGEMGFGK